MWLSPQFGQLGLGRSTPDAYVPEIVTSLANERVIDVAAGVSGSRRINACSDINTHPATLLGSNRAGTHTCTRCARESTS